LAYAEAPLSLAKIAAAMGHKQRSCNLRKALPVLRKAGLTLRLNMITFLSIYHLVSTKLPILQRIQKAIMDKVN
jgi:hypothetical protein